MQQNELLQAAIMFEATRYAPTVLETTDLGETPDQEVTAFASELEAYMLLEYLPALPEAFRMAGHRMVMDLDYQRLYRDTTGKTPGALVVKTDGGWADRAVRSAMKLFLANRADHLTTEALVSHLMADLTRQKFTPEEALAWSRAVVNLDHDRFLNDAQRS